MVMRRRTFLVKSSRAAFGCCLVPLVAEAQRDLSAPGFKSNAIIAELEKLIPALMEQSVVPGVSIALVQDGQLLWSRGFGVKDSATEEPVDNDTVFEAASISKTV